MDKQLIGIYEMRIWSDGAIEIVRNHCDVATAGISNPVATNKPLGSSRINQILQVISIALEGIQNEQAIDELAWKRIVTKSVKNVADHFSVNETTVRDKINRQIGLRHTEFIAMLIKYHNSKGHDKTLKYHLMSFLSNHTYDEDKILVDDSFERFRKVYQ